MANVTDWKTSDLLQGLLEVGLESHLHPVKLLLAILKSLSCSKVHTHSIILDGEEECLLSKLAWKSRQNQWVNVVTCEIE